MYLYIFFVILEAVYLHVYMYISKPRGCHFIFLSLETVTCMWLTSVYFLSLGLFMLMVLDTEWVGRVG